MLAQIEELHPDEVRVVFRHFPLFSIHDKASLAGQAAEAAGAQDAFWEMHDYLFENYADWYSLPPNEFVTWLESAAGELDFDVSKFTAELEGGVYETVLIEAYNRALSRGLTGTPSIFINEYQFQTPPEIEYFEAYTQLVLLQDHLFSEYPEMVYEPDKDYVARVKMNIGEVLIQLFPESAPRAVNSFIFLANSGWFNDNIVFEVVPNVRVMSGDPSSTGAGNPGYYFAGEFDPALTFDSPGMVALYNQGPDTNGSIFFVSLSSLPEYNEIFTIFGRVVEGLDLLMNLNEREPIADILVAPEAYIESITIEER